MRTRPAPARPRDRGLSLVELLVAIVILGIGGVAVLGAVGTAAKGSSVQRKQADAQAALATASRAITGVTPSSTCSSAEYENLAKNLLQSNSSFGSWTVKVEAVRGYNTAIDDWRPKTGNALVDCIGGSIATADPMQLVTLAVTSPDGKTTRRIDVATNSLTTSAPSVSTSTTVAASTTTTTPGITPIGDPVAYGGAVFNMVSAGDVTMSGMQVYGAMAVGGNLTFSGSGPLAANDQGTFRPGIGETSNVGLLVGGRVTGTSSLYVNNGASVVIGDMSNGKFLAPGGTNCYVLNNPNATQCQDPQIALQGGGKAVSGRPFDFAAAFASYRQTSSALAALPGSCVNAASAVLRNESDTAPWSGAGGNYRLKLTPNKVNVLNLTAVQVTTLGWGSNIGTDVPSASTPLIINVTDNGGVGFNAPNFTQNFPKFVIWNFPNATSVAYTNAVWGSMYAPNASITLSGDVRGVVIAKSFTASGGVADWSNRPTINVACDRAA